MAGGSVKVPPVTTVTSGSPASIVILGRIDVSGTVTLTMRYPRHIVSVSGARGSASYGLQCDNISILSNTELNSTTGELVLECGAGSANASDTLFILDVTAMTSTMPIGELVPTKVNIDGSTVADAELVGGVIQLSGGSHQSPEALEGVTGNYPNPFGLTTRFVYAMSVAGPVSFTIVSSQGRIVKELSSAEATVGENTIDLTLQPNELSQGIYLLRMITDRGVYYHSFMILH